MDINNEFSDFNEFPELDVFSDEELAELEFLIDSTFALLRYFEENGIPPEEYFDYPQDELDEEDDLYDESLH